MGALTRWVLLAACAVASPSVRADDSGVATRARLLEAQARFGATLLNQLRSSGPDAVAVSPASAAGVLTSVFLGADDSARAALGTVLQVQPGPTASGDMDAVGKALTGRPAGDEMTSATRMVFAPSAMPTPAASERLAGAGIDVAVEDLSTQAAVDDINAWAAKATHGKVSEILDQPSGTLGIVALNALYFAGHWQVPFTERDTQPADFLTEAGGRIRAPFMHSPPGDFARREDAGFVAVDLPFQQGRFSMVILTTKGAPVGLPAFGAHLGWLAGQGFGRLAIPTVVDLPRLQVTTDCNLLPALVDLGFRAKGPFPNLTAAKVDFSEIRQKLDVSLDESGAKVAVVTSGGFEIQSGIAYANVSEVVVDRPFVFALREQQTGLIVAEGFVGAVEGAVVADGQPVLSARSKSVMSNRDFAAQTAAQRSGATTKPADTFHVHLRLDRNF